MLKLTLSSLLLLSLGATAQTKSLEDRVAELEAQSSINIFSFSGTLNTRYDDLTVKQTTQNGTALTTPIDNKGLNFMRMRFSLNADANVSSNLKVYSRLTTTKMFNSWRQQGVAQDNAYQQGLDLRVNDNYVSDVVTLEKAYMDVTIPDSNYIFSIGRFPTADGPPANYWDGKSRQGTYALMAYGSVLDGMALTYKLDQYLPKNDTLAIRVLYTPFVSSNTYQAFPTNDSTSTLPGATSPTAAAPANTPTGTKTDTLVQFFTQQVDYTSKNLGFAESLNAILQHYSFKNLQFANNSGIGATAAIAASSLGIDADSTSFALDMQSLFGSSFDLSASVLVTAVKSHGFYAAGANGYGTTLENDTTYGSTTLISTRYRMSSWILGAEYVDGKKGVFYTGNTAEDLTNFYGTPGTAYHVYVTKKFQDNLSLRLGHYNQEYKFTPLSVGNIADTDKKITTMYANLRLDF